MASDEKKPEPAYLLVRITEEATGHSTDIGDFNFDVLPRTGELVTLFFRNELDESYRVKDIEYHFHDHTDSPLILIRVDREE